MESSRHDPEYYAGNPELISFFGFYIRIARQVSLADIGAEVFMLLAGMIHFQSKGIDGAPHGNFIETPLTGGYPESIPLHEDNKESII